MTTLSEPRDIVSVRYRHQQRENTHSRRERALRIDKTIRTCKNCGQEIKAAPFVTVCDACMIQEQRS
jgi:hypothetical protein